MNSNKLIASFSLLASLALLPSAALAGTTATPPPSVAAPSEEPGGWRFNLTTYAWLTDINGDLTIAGVQAPIDIGMDDILSDLKFAYMGFFEVGYGKWSLGIDGMYAKVGDDHTFAKGPIEGNASLDQEQAWITARLQYSLVNSSAIKLDVFAGARWNYFDVDLSVDTNITRGRGIGVTKDWFDPIIGARAIFALGEDWYLQTMGEVGGFGIDNCSDVTWQALAGFGYNFTPSVSAVLGYRVLGTDYSDGKFGTDTVSHGPAAGLSVKF